MCAVCTRRGQSYTKQAYSETENSTVNDTHTCTTTTAFGAYGVPDGSDLIQRTYHELTDGTTETDASRIRFGELDTAFRRAFTGLTTLGELPPVVEAALADGLYFTREQYEGTDADLRTVVVPAFYREVAGFLCAYR